MFFPPGLGILGILATGFWLLMIYDCVKNDPQKNQWLWILIFLPYWGALIYFLVRRLPQISIPMPRQFTRWTRRRELWTAEANARNIGKAHQYVLLGNLLSETGLVERAETAYKTALEKEPDNLQALWGVSSISLKNQDFEAAYPYLQTLMKRQPDFKYGDVSLAYCRTLCKLGHTDQAIVQLERDIREWSHPESAILLATIYAQQGKQEAMRPILETMIARVNGSSYFHYRRSRPWVAKAEKMLRSLR